jgi:hypothetical protein
MDNIIKVLIGLAALAFILAVIGSLTDFHLLGVIPEAYSRASNNLGIIAIALSLLFKDKLPIVKNFSQS